MKMFVQHAFHYFAIRVRFQRGKTITCEAIKNLKISMKALTNKGKIDTRVHKWIQKLDIRKLDLLNRRIEQLNAQPGGCRISNLSTTNHELFFIILNINPNYFQ